MPGRFYFAPVRGRAGGVMAGLAEGIDRGVESFNRARETARQVRRQEEEDRRRRLFEDVEMDEFLAQRGGGRGAVPTVDTTVRGPADFERPELEMPEFNPDRGGIGMRAPQLTGGFNFDPIEVAIPRQDPRFRAVGPDGFGYVKTPEAIEEEDYARALGRKNAERDDLVGRVGPIAGSIASGRIGRDDEEFGDAAVRLGAEGFDAFDFLPPTVDPNEGWQPTTRDDYFLSRGRDPKSGRLLDRNGGSSGRDYGVPTYEEAVEILKSLYPGQTQGPDGYYDDTSLSAEEMHRLATEMSSGGDPVFPPRPEAQPPEPEGIPSIGKVPGFRGFGQRLFPGGESGYQIEMLGPDGEPMEDDTAAPPARTEVPRSSGASSGGKQVSMVLTDDDVQEIRASLEKFPRRQWRSILEEENAAVDPGSRLTPQEIDQIVGER